MFLCTCTSTYVHEPIKTKNKINKNKQKLAKNEIINFFFFFYLSIYRFTNKYDGNIGKYHV